MTDLTLHEYRNFSGEKLKRMLKAEALKIYGPDTFVEDLESETNAFRSPTAYRAKKTREILFRFFGRYLRGSGVARNND